jgi:hypothetical protein
MSFSVSAIVSETLSIDMDDLSIESSLCDDLNITHQQKTEITEELADAFDGFMLNWENVKQYGDIISQVIQSEFDDHACRMS